MDRRDRIFGTNGSGASRNGTTPSTNGATRSTDDWLWRLRKDARRAMVRRIVMDRIKNGGLQDAPPPSTASRLKKVFEHPLVVAVAAAVVGGYVSSKFVERRKR